MSINRRISTDTQFGMQHRINYALYAALANGMRDALQLIVNDETAPPLARVNAGILLADPFGKEFRDIVDTAEHSDSAPQYTLFNLIMSHVMHGVPTEDD